MICYFNDHIPEYRCKKEAIFDEYWCSEEHKKAWQAVNYKGKVKTLTVKEIQRGFERIIKDLKDRKEAK